MTFVGLLAAGVGVLQFWPRRSRIYGREEVIDHLLATFDYLNPDREQTGQFVDLFLQHYNAAPPQDAMPFVERIYLMSTDYFPSGQPASGPVRFVQLYHPYVHPCYNPFTQPNIAG